MLTRPTGYPWLDAYRVRLHVQAIKQRLGQEADDG